MEQLGALTKFFKAISTDPRIGVSHISLYCALLQNCNDVNSETPLTIEKLELMRIAKISGRATYHKCLSDLHNCGYIKYQPSYDYRKKSKVYLFTTSKSPATSITGKK